jgi:hypothetical protein
MLSLFKLEKNIIGWGQKKFVNFFLKIKFGDKEIVLHLVLNAEDKISLLETPA